MTFYFLAFWTIYIATLIAIGHDLYTDYKQNNARIFQDNWKETILEMIAIILMLTPLVNTLTFLRHSSEQRQLLIQALK